MSAVKKQQEQQEICYEFPISRKYVRGWGFAEGVRELLQNALDSESPFNWMFYDEALRINSVDSELSTKTLLLGNTGKENDEESIGSHGEGYKLALLVLAREGKAPVVWNNGKKWTCEFRKSVKFDGAEIFCIIETSANCDGLTFEVNNLTTAEKQTIIDGCLQMQRKRSDSVIETRFGEILLDRKGKLYVGGLFVCDTALEFSYNFKPRYLKLERDRKTIDNWNLLWNTKEIWFAADQPDRVAELMERNCKDLEMAEFGAPEFVKAACFKLFQSQHKGKVLAKNQEELERLVKRGLEVKIYSGGGYYSSVTNSSGYSASKVEVETALAVRSPIETLTDYFERNKKFMRKQAIVELKEILKSATKWK